MVTNSVLYGQIRNLGVTKDVKKNEFKNKMVKMTCVAIKKKWDLNPIQFWNKMTKHNNISATKISKKILAIVSMTVEISFLTNAILKIGFNDKCFTLHSETHNL